jgi:hypothetical protein
VESSSPSTVKMQDVVDLSSSPPVGLVVVRGTPPRVLNTFSGSRNASKAVSRNSPSKATPNPECDSVNRRAPPAYSFSNAFRLQPRGCGNTILPSPSPARNPTSGGLSSGSNSSGGRKRGANCLASSGTSSSFSVIPRRALFPPKNVAPLVTAAASSSTTSSTASHLSPAPWSPEESACGMLLTASSPGRVGNALQSLSLKSPIGTPQERQMCWKGRETSPFRVYASPITGNAHPEGFFIHGRGRGETVGSIASCSSARTPGSASRFSPRQAPVLVIQNDGQEEKKTFSPLHPLCSSYVVSLNNKLEILETPVVAITSTLHTPPEVVQTQVATPETHRCTPRMHDAHTGLSTPHSQRSASKRMIGFPSPHETPLPRIKLTPRQIGGSDRLTPTSMKRSPQDLDLLLSPASSGVFDPAIGPPSVGENISTSSFQLPSLPRRSITSDIRTVSAYVPVPSWSPRKSIFPWSQHSPMTEENNSTGERPAVVIRSLLAPCNAFPSPSLQAMVTADAEAAALDCDGSLTDDDDDDGCEPFVLTDPAILVAERHESSDECCRPSRRRRTSVETDCNHVVVVNKPLGSHQVSSSTSLIGMAFLRGDSMNSFGNSRSQQQLYNYTLDSSASSESSNPRTNEFPGTSDEDVAMNRLKSKESLESIGLDLEPSSWDLKEGRNPTTTTAQISERDLHTPPALQDAPPADSTQLLDRPLLYQSSEKFFGRVREGPVYISRSDPGDVHRTIASLVAQEQQQSPAMVCKS